MRARYASTSARAVTRPSRRAFTVSWMVSWVHSLTASLLQDARHSELPGVRVGGVREDGPDRIGRPHLVVPHDVHEREDVGSGLDARGVDAAELLDVAEDRVELAPHPLFLVGGESEPREPRDVLDLCQCDLHVAHRVPVPSMADRPGGGTPAGPGWRNPGAEP